MDAKNLEVLRQLKRAMDEAKAEPTATAQSRPHVPGQGFSEESERIFQELAKKRLGLLVDDVTGDIVSDPSQRRTEAERSQHQQDRLNRLSEINRALSATETTKTKVSNGGANPERRQPVRDKNSVRTKPKTPWPTESVFRPNAKPKPVPPPIVAPAPKPVSPQGPAQWETKTCRFCKCSYVVNLLWKRIPIMCKGCQNERRNSHYQIPEGDTLYTTTQVFHGGGPGTGRRK